MTRHVNFAIIPALPLVSFCKWKFIRKEQLPSAPSPSSSLTLPSCQQTTEASDLWFFGPKIWRIVLHLRKLTWNPKIGGWKMSFLLERHILRPYVSFRVCVFRFQPNFLVQNFESCFKILGFSKCVGLFMPSHFRFGEGSGDVETS